MAPAALKRLLLAVCLLLAALPAAARSYRISDFHDSIAVDTDGAVQVTERITFVFIGPFQGIHRRIPLEYPGPHGTNFRLFLKVLSVTDADGNPLKYDSSVKSGYRVLTVYIPGAHDTSKTIEITYTSPNAVRFFEDYDEFYWNVTGNDWPVPIDHADAMVSLPSNAAGSLRAQAFTGTYGSKEKDALVNLNGAVANFETANPLPIRGGLTADIYIPKGILHHPSALTRVMWFIRSNPVVWLPVWAFAVMFSLWWVKGRDPDPGISVAPQYAPPKNMTPAECGTLVDDAIAPRDITCTLVDLAVRGYVKIEQTTSKVLMFTSHDYTFHLLKPMQEWGQDLAPHERVMLENVFQGGQMTRLSDLKNRFYTAIPVIREDIFSALKQKGMYLLDPESANAYAIAGAIAVAAPFVAGQYLGWFNLFDTLGLTILCGIVAAVIIFLFGRQMSAKTLLGARTKVAILGFQEFMNRVDADRLKRMPPDTFEKFLPYAMALGVEHRWAQAFAGIITQPPGWYTGYDGGAFNPIFFTNSMHSMASEVHETFVSAPRSSSTSSGFGGGGDGGGFSGGGFGGGGGDAF